MKLNNRRKKQIFNIIFLAPACIVFIVFVLVPFIQGIPLSFYEWDGYSDVKTFTGFSNYLMLFQDNNVPEVIGNTLWFTAFYLVGFL